ncbi:hypothetical protein Tco_1255885 [Tanacetum coccineum]
MILSGDEVDDSPLDFAEEIFQQELARLKGQEQRATSDAKDAEELQKRASTKIVPTGSIPVPSSDTMISPSDVPVPTGSPTDSFFDDDPTTRFPSPSDLGNNEPSPGIFSSSSYDDEFGADLNNLASTVELCKREARPDIMFAVSACSRFQVTPTTSNLEAVKKIFKYLKGQPRLGLWYPRESPFVLEAVVVTDDYAVANRIRSPELGPPAILATIDETLPYTITKDSVRSQLQLADDGWYMMSFTHCGNLFWNDNL